MASGGGIGRLNMLAGRSSAVAALENAPGITEEHVRKVIDESGIKYPFDAGSWSKWYSPINRRHGASIAASMMMLALLRLAWFARPIAGCFFCQRLGSRRCGYYAITAQSFQPFDHRVGS